jgi:hypothetical protein
MKQELKAIVKKTELAHVMEIFNQDSTKKWLYLSCLDPVAMPDGASVGKASIGRWRYKKESKTV